MRIPKRWPILLVALPLLAATPAWAVDAADVLKQADGLLQTGHASDAEALLAGGVVRFPRDVALHLRYGHLLEKQELTGLARAHYKAAVTAEPSNANALAAYGHALIASMDSDEALVVLRKAAELDPRNAAVAYDLGRLLIRSGADAEAEATRWYDRAMALDPGNQDAQLEYAQVLQAQEKTDKAQTILERLAAAKPGNYHAQIRLGRMLIEGGKDKARGLNLLLAAYDQVIADKDPDADMSRVFLLAELIRILDEEKRPDDMVRVAEQYVAARPDAEEGYMALMATQAKLKRWEDAERTIARLRTRQPGNALADRAMAAIEAERGRWPLARDWFLKAVKRAPDDAELRRDFGAQAEQNKAYADAVAQYRQLVRLKPDVAEAYVRLARSLAQTGPKAKPEALKLLQQALKLDKGNDEAKALLKTLGGGR